MKAVRALMSFGLAIAAAGAVSFGSNDVAVLDTDEARAVQAGTTGQFTPQCFQFVSDCIVCTSNNMSCTQSGRIDACRLTPPPTLCAVVVPPTCGLKIKWFMPNCGGIGAIAINNFCFEFICA